MSRLRLFVVIVVGGAASKAWTAFRENRLPLSPRWWVQMLLLHCRETRANFEDASSPQGLDRARLDTSYNRWLLDQGQSEAADGRGPHLSIAALVDDPAHLDAVIESVVSQSFEDWELSLIPLRWRDDYHGILERRPRDPRLRIVSLDEILRVDGTWLPPGSSDSVVFLDTESVFAPGALARIARTTQRQPNAWIYTDDDLLDDAGRRSDPNLKGAFSPELALVDDYATRLAVSPRRAVIQVGGLRRASTARRSTTCSSELSRVASGLSTSLTSAAIGVLQYRRCSPKDTDRRQARHSRAEVCRPRSSPRSPSSEGCQVSE